MSIFGVRKPKPTIAHPGAPQFYSYHEGPTFHGSGAGKMVFNPLFQLPGILFRGAGRLPKRSFMVFQGPQLNYAQAVPNTGLGGVVTGSIALQPLLLANPQVQQSEVF
jgi:hypothetical protein